MIGRTGAARLATLVPGVQVIPVAQWGVQKSVDLYRKRVSVFPRPKHVLSVGLPIDLAPFRERIPAERTPVRSDVQVLREVTGFRVRRLRQDVAELRHVPEPAGAPLVWRRPGERAGDVA